MDAQYYAELIKKHISSCLFLEDHPHFPTPIEIPENNPYSLFWTDKISLQRNLCLTVMEQAFFDDDGIVERSFSYDLREKVTGRLVWRIDNHCQRQPVTNPCHVHAFPDDPDRRTECFADSKRTIFPYAIHCVKNFFEGRPQEWEESRNDED